jgi:hypothetical protein
MYQHAERFPQTLSRAKRFTLTSLYSREGSEQLQTAVDAPRRSWHAAKRVQALCTEGFPCSMECVACHPNHTRSQ